MSNRKFLFLYLNTGAGHISAAKVLASAMKQENPSVEIEMKLGFKKNGISRVFFEKENSKGKFSKAWQKFYRSEFFDDNKSFTQNLIYQRTFA